MKAQRFVIACCSMFSFASAYSPIQPRIPSRRDFLSSALAVGSAVALGDPAANAQDLPAGFRPIPRRFIAALGDPNSSQGEGAASWGIWTVDPGPRGVFLRDSRRLVKEGIGPYGWKFDEGDWWLEEHGIVMETPDFPLEAGEYIVTGGRGASSVLTISSDGQWVLQGGAKLGDVTHLPCRAARYTEKKGVNVCLPSKARMGNFPVRPGAAMPEVFGCSKQDYAILFNIGVPF
eukprot:CAMPEP_0113536946 /NCGR_PEP_ID=MMETSP0015_2-20120614/6553_1 /TAXON_ID=2838 /ORGANISM="Odontella" /LENGTH=232 /DNA_ID=CAMNT_0000436387 /DNA_START=234 /DNA_END=932 /DNA_ORIENTATION=+ /assembly_acc=CAM_ASM_000160